MTAAPWLASEAGEFGPRRVVHPAIALACAAESELHPNPGLWIVCEWASEELRLAVVRSAGGAFELLEQETVAFTAPGVDGERQAASDLAVNYVLDFLSRVAAALGLPQAVVGAGEVLKIPEFASAIESVRAILPSAAVAVLSDPEWAVARGVALAAGRNGIGAVAGTAVNTSSALESVIEPMPACGVEAVHFSVTGPGAVLPGSRFLLDVWAHLASQEAEVMRLAGNKSRKPPVSLGRYGPMRLARGTHITARLVLNGFTCLDEECFFSWEGEIGNVSYQVLAPEELADGEHYGTVMIYVDGFRAARLEFALEIGRAEKAAVPLGRDSHPTRSAFVSYASKDWEAVKPRLQGIDTAIHTDFWIDRHNLKPGQDWEANILRQIPQSDVFYLFWSRNARESDVVRKELQCALDAKGLDFIDPVPLEPAHVAPPPPELSHMHFSHWTLGYQRWRTFSEPSK